MEIVFFLKATCARAAAFPRAGGRRDITRWALKSEMTWFGDMLSCDSLHLSLKKKEHVKYSTRHPLHSMLHGLNTRRKNMKIERKGHTEARSQECIAWSMHKRPKKEQEAKPSCTINYSGRLNRPKHHAHPRIIHLSNFKIHPTYFIQITQSVSIFQQNLSMFFSRHGQMSSFSIGKYNPNYNKLGKLGKTDRKHTRPLKGSNKLQTMCVRWGATAIPMSPSDKLQSTNTFRATLWQIFFPNLISWPIFKAPEPAKNNNNRNPVWAISAYKIFLSIPFTFANPQRSSVFLNGVIWFTWIGKKGEWMRTSRGITRPGFFDRQRWTMDLPIQLKPNSRVNSIEIVLHPTLTIQKNNKNTADGWYWEKLVQKKKQQRTIYEPISRAANIKNLFADSDMCSKGNTQFHIASTYMSYRWWKMWQPLLITEMGPDGK